MHTVSTCVFLVLWAVWEVGPALATQAARGACAALAAAVGTVLYLVT